MTSPIEAFLAEHERLTRRWFLKVGAAGAVAACGVSPARAAIADRDPRLQEALGKLESWLTEPDRFRDVSRGTPKPHSIPDDKKPEVGLTRETWKLEIVSDPENPARLGKTFTKADGTAIDFASLLKIGETKAVRFAKVMTCLNIGCPLGMGIWEGVPLRELLWMTEPRENLRRVFYHGYHNDDAKQLFRSSLPVGRVLEDPDGVPPVIVCWKLNDQWLTPERGGPVRMVVPEGYGFKSIKWLTHVVLSNLGAANDTYLTGNNDVDSPLKTFAATLHVPKNAKPNESLPITGYAQVGIAGLSKVQVWLHPEDAPLPAGRYFEDAPWVDAEILGPPADWGGGLPEGRLPLPTRGFDPASGRPTTWPMRLAKAHWAALIPGVPAGTYVLRCRTIDANGAAQPMPRPFRKSGHAAIEEVDVVVKG